MARKFSAELKDRAVRLEYEHQEVHACSRLSAALAICPKLCVSEHSIVEWMKKDAASAQAGKGSLVDYAAQNARLHAENLKLRRVNELLKEAWAFLGSELAPRCLEMITFIDQYRDRFEARVHLPGSDKTLPGWFHECSWLPCCEKPPQLRSTSS